MFTEKDYQALLEKFSSLADENFKEHHSKLTPGATISYGIRTPQMKSIAKEIVKDDPEGFLKVSRPDSYEETFLRGLVIAAMKLDISEKIELMRDFVPLIDNWATCDMVCCSLKPKKSEEKIYWDFIKPYYSHEEEFFVRFAVVTTLSKFVKDEYIDEAIELVAGVTHEAYYVQMACAWAVSVFYIKFPEKTLDLIKSNRLNKFTQNKSIQKIRESFRVDKESKDMLLNYKVK